MSDAHFAGSIPAIYEECLVPVLFVPFAADLVSRAAMQSPAQILELAAGTGVVSRRLAQALPSASIIATDLNPAMLDIARRSSVPDNLVFETADAQALGGYGEAAFDLVVAQFGAMFFPDRIGAYREVRRVLAPGKAFLFNVWDRLEANSGSHAIHRAVQKAVPEPKPQFIARTPFGYHDPAQIEQELHAAGFDEVSIVRAELTSPAGSAARLARGLCLGSPLANELALHPEPVRDHALQAAVAAAEEAEAAGPLTMSALVIAAR